MPETGKTKCDGWNDSVPIPSSMLQKAVEKGLLVLGRAAVESVLEDLEKEGINLNASSSSYTLCQIEVAFDKIFGKDITPLLIEKINRELEK